MRALVGGAWRDGFLDPHRGAHDVRIAVRAWAAVEPVSELYFERRRDLRVLGGYLPAIGPRAVLRKVRSRLGESHRNEKWLSYGIGRLLEGDLAEHPTDDSLIAFLAPKHPRCVDTVVVPRELAGAVAANDVPPLSPDEVRFVDPEAAAGDRGWSALAGWDRESGEELPPALVAQWVERLEAAVRETDWASARRLPAPRERSVVERTEAPSRATAEKRVVLFGYGNYAKTTLIPHLCSQLPLACVHDLDPLQVPSSRPSGVAWDTAPWPRPEEACEVYAIAGYHHTHAPLAAEALARGADAVIEKPIATSHEQLDSLLAALRSASGGAYACFNRRYLPANEWALEDLCPDGPRPISYHCIVFEEPLPARHWYRWPTSRTRLLSNGCHWLDHFLFLNGFAAPVSQRVSAVDDDTTSCEVRLENGAVFTMVLTDRGSSRIGVREHVELRVDDATATIVDSSRYVAEDRRRVLRRRRLNPLAGHRSMYRTIGNSIAAGGPGDSHRSLELSARLAIDLDRELAESGARALP